MKLKTLFLLIFAIASIWISKTAYANQSSFNVIAKNISVKDKVIRLNLPVEGFRFYIFWVTEDGKKWEKTHFARKGDHAYEMRNHPAWNGKAKVVVVPYFQNITGKVKQPMFEDEIDIFLAPEQWVPSTINLLYGHTFLGLPWNIILLLLMLLSAVALYFYKIKSLVVSLLLGFIIAWGVMDVRTMYDHFVVADKIEDNQSMNLIKDLKTAGKILAEKIGPGKWTQKRLTWPYNNVIAYTLAEHQYVPYQSDSKADFVIEQRNGQLVLLKRGKE